MTNAIPVNWARLTGSIGVCAFLAGIIMRKEEASTQSQLEQVTSKVLFGIGAALSLVSVGNIVYSKYFHDSVEKKAPALKPGLAPA